MNRYIYTYIHVYINKYVYIYIYIYENMFILRLPPPPRLREHIHALLPDVIIVTLAFIASTKAPPLLKNPAHIDAAVLQIRPQHARH